MNKKWLILAVLILFGGLAYAAATIFTDVVEVHTVNTRAFVVQEDFPSPKDHFRVDSTAGGKIYTTSVVPIGSPNPTLGEPGNSYAGVYGQHYNVTASLGITCNDACNKMDGIPANANAVCVKAFFADLNDTTCSDNGRLKNCVCKN